MGYFGSVRFFKNMILLAFIIMIAIPTATSFYLKGQLESAREELQARQDDAAALAAEKTALEENVRELQLELDAVPEQPQWPDFRAESPYEDLYPDFYAPQELTEGKRDTGVIYLTFDDGPSARTGEILNVLKEKDVKATFFVIGSKDEGGLEMLRRIVEEGHTLAMHTYSHSYTTIYASVEDYLADMYRIFTQIKDSTGVAPTLFRFPGGSINAYNSGIYQELISEMLRRGFIPFDWNLSNLDASSTRVLPAQTLVDNVVENAKKVERGIVLMHDANAKTTTVQALGPTIDGLRANGFTLEALTPEVMPVLYDYRH